VTAWLNDTIFSNLGARLPAGYIDLALGFRPGTLGESALLIVLLGSLVLISLRLIRFAIPVSMLGTFMILVRVFGSGLPGEEVMTGDVLFALSGGGVMLAAFYMATDPVSSPVSKKLCVVYGAAVGTLTFIFRRWGACTESVAYAVLIMNVLTPFLEQTARASVLKRGKVAHHG
ncbi:MAG: RnfABCDGE type electron transport complex subunit D, partial [Spirochaetales bacterium]|nr:RnfABCDGE type electron transport complex subunit D [Spirochaetales bacterium]